MQPRGIRNNNPLNIRRGKSHWLGARRTVTDKEFEEFQFLSFGYRAAWILLKNYYSYIILEGGHYTLSAIIHRWAPPEDGNDTKAYIHSIIRLTGGQVVGNRPLPLPHTQEGKCIFALIIRAMTCIECGIGWDEVDTEMIEKGWQQAFEGMRR